MAHSARAGVSLDGDRVVEDVLFLRNANPLGVERHAPF